MTKAYRLCFGKALALEDLPSFLLPLHSSCSPSTDYCLYFVLLFKCPSLKFPSTFLLSFSLHSSFEMLKWWDLLLPVGKMHIYCGSSIAKRSFQKLSLESGRPNMYGCATVYHLFQSNRLISCNVAFALIKQLINRGIIQTGNCS